MIFISQERDSKCWPTSCVGEQNTPEMGGGRDVYVWERGGGRGDETDQSHAFIARAIPIYTQMILRLRGINELTPS